jgi:hypothetical protein
MSCIDDRRIWIGRENKKGPSLYKGGPRPSKRAERRLSKKKEV